MININIILLLFFPFGPEVTYKCEIKYGRNISKVSELRNVNKCEAGKKMKNRIQIQNEFICLAEFQAILPMCVHKLLAKST